MEDEAAPAVSARGAGWTNGLARRGGGGCTSRPAVCATYASSPSSWLWQCLLIITESPNPTGGTWWGGGGRRTHRPLNGEGMCGGLRSRVADSVARGGARSMGRHHTAPRCACRCAPRLSERNCSYRNKPSVSLFLTGNGGGWGRVVTRRAGDRHDTAPPPPWRLTPLAPLNPLSRSPPVRAPSSAGGHTRVHLWSAHPVPAREPPPRASRGEDKREKTDARGGRRGAGGGRWHVA